MPIRKGGALVLLADGNRTETVIADGDVSGTDRMVAGGVTRITGTNRRDPGTFCSCRDTAIGGVDLGFRWIAPFALLRVQRSPGQRVQSRFGPSPMFTTAAPASTNDSERLVLRPQTDAVEVALARSRSELTAAFRLLYNAYVRAGLAAENGQQLRLTPFHLRPETEVFVAKLRGEVIATMTMVPDGDGGLPMDSMYREEADGLRGSGMRVAEMGSFAERRESPQRFLRVLGELSRLVVQVARARGIDGLVAATHPRHARFYVRSLGFRQFGDIRDCPYAQGNPAVALVQEFAELPEPIHDRLFGKPFGPETLIKTCWDDETRRYLHGLVRPAELPLSDRP